MFRFALAYQGSGGEITYIAGGSDINVSFYPAAIDIQGGESVNIITSKSTLDVVLAGKVLDLQNGGTNINI